MELSAARVLVRSATPGNGTESSPSSFAAAAGNPWITPKKVASKPPFKPNTENLAPNVGGSRFNSLALEEDPSVADVMPMQVLQSEAADSTRGNASTSKEKCKRFPTQSSPTTRSSPSVSPPQTKVIVREMGTNVDPLSKASNALILYSKGFGKNRSGGRWCPTPLDWKGHHCLLPPHSDSQESVHASLRPGSVDHSTLVTQVLQELSSSSPTSNSNTQAERVEADPRCVNKGQPSSSALQ
ncbi:uncharacterized protein [Elaeis guineensis]|uniref:uncharacterized protein n=1 Tax=Elaeis guineensis var. tenera TaxID=51953 RepID=UPI000579CF25